jgi:hypothetical protein
VRSSQRSSLAAVLAVACWSLTSGCGFLADEFWYVDRAAPVRALVEEESFMRAGGPAPPWPGTAPDPAPVDRARAAVVPEAAPRRGPPPWHGPPRRWTAPARLAARAAR